MLGRRSDAASAGILGVVARDSASEFQAQRTRLFGLAYRLLGSAEDAEDVVQDAFLRWDGADRSAITTSSAWLAKVVTNLSLNRLTSARARRERYVGPWLPEPGADLRRRPGAHGACRTAWFCFERRSSRCCARCSSTMVPPET